MSLLYWGQGCHLIILDYSVWSKHVFGGVYQFQGWCTAGPWKISGPHECKKHSGIQRKPLHEAASGRATQQMSLKKKNSIILKIRNVHAVVKMGRPFKDYAYLWNLDKAKGLDHCTTYNNPSSAMRFLHAIVETVRVKTRDIIDSCRFVSLTCDGSMDCCGKEQELVYLRTCHEGKVIQRFLTIGQP